MRRFGFVYSVRFWVAVWLGFLFVGLLPLPAGCGAGDYGRRSLPQRLVHGRPYSPRGTVAGAGQGREGREEEYRRQRRRRSPQRDSSDPSSRIRLLEPGPHDMLAAAPEDQR